MPYKAPKKVKGGYVLPKVTGGVHKSKSGKVIKFHSARAAEAAGRYIVAAENKLKK